MRYQVDIDQNSLIWKTGDKPEISGTITADNGLPDLLGVTIRLLSPTGELFLESIATAYSNLTGIFSFILPEILTAKKQGLVYVAALEDSTYTRTLSVTISATDSIVTLTGSTGALPQIGYCLIDSEWIQYSLTGSQLTMIKRGAFNTTISSHLINTTVSFTNSKQTCIPDMPFDIRDIMELWQQLPII